MRIGICDDSDMDLKYICNTLNSILEKRDIECDIECFTDGNEFAKNYSKFSDYDLLLLDIDMPGIGGIELSTKLLEINNMANIIFITNHVEMVFEAIHRQPFRFIRKEHIHTELEESLISVINKISEEALIYDFGTGHEKVKIRLIDVVYLESKAHYIHIHTTETTHVIRGKISEYENKLNSYGFLRVHLGYLVNIKYVTTITSKDITLDTGETLPISRKNAEKIKLAHADYGRRFMRGIS